MKYLLLMALLTVSNIAHSDIIQVDTHLSKKNNYGLMFVLPARITSNSGGTQIGNVRNVNIPMNYVGFRYSFTDTMAWFDAGQMWSSQKSINGDFTLGLWIGEQLVGESIITDDDRDGWYSGSIFNSEPIETPTDDFRVMMSLTPYSGYGNPATDGLITFDNRESGVWVSDDNQLLFVPESSTVFMLLVGITGIVLRRKLK